MHKEHGKKVTVISYNKTIPEPRHQAGTQKQSRAHPKGKMFSPELNFQQPEMVLFWLQITILAYGIFTILTEVEASFLKSLKLV